MSSLVIWCEIKECIYNKIEIILAGYTVSYNMYLNVSTHLLYSHKYISLISFLLIALQDGWMIAEAEMDFVQNVSNIVHAMHDDDDDVVGK